MWLNFDNVLAAADENMTNLSLSVLWENASGLNVTVFSPTCDSNWFRPVVSVTSAVYFFLSIFAMIPNFLLVYAVAKSKLLHPNVRVLLISLTISCVLTCVALTLQSIYNFLLLFSGDVKQPITTRACAVMQNLRFTSNHITLFTLLLLSFERLVSTNARFLKTSYQKALTIFVCALSVLSWLYAVIFTFYDWVPSRGDQYGLCYCENSLNFAFNDLMIYVLTYMVTDFAALTCFWLVYKISRSALRDFGINTANHSLTARFQIWHNIRMLEMLLPSVAVHVACLLCCSCILAACVRLYQTRKEGLGITLLQIYYFLIVLHVVAHPLICIKQNTNIGKSLVKLLHGRFAELFLHGHEAAKVGAVDNVRDRGDVQALARDSSLSHKKRKKQPLLRNTVGYRVSPDHHQKLMNTIWDTTKDATLNRQRRMTKSSKM